eukprot:jgi/Botrbrau1/20044/Bobra.200_1s0049.1
MQHQVRPLLVLECLHFPCEFSLTLPQHEGGSVSRSWVKFHPIGHPAKIHSTSTRFEK